MVSNVHSRVFWILYKYLMTQSQECIGCTCIHRTTIFSAIGTHYSLTEDVRMRWRTLGLRKSRCIRENPVFPHVIYRKKARIFETCLEQMLHNAGHWAVTLNISKKINWLLKWLNFSLRICFASSVAILLGFVIHWYPSVSATFAPVLL